MIELRDATVTVRSDGGVRTLLQPTTCTLTERRVAVIGANGSGKSTLARLVNGLVLPSAGAVRSGRPGHRSGRCGGAASRRVRLHRSGCAAGDANARRGRRPLAAPDGAGCRPRCRCPCRARAVRARRPRRGAGARPVRRPEAAARAGRCARGAAGRAGLRRAHDAAGPALAARGGRAARLPRPAGAAGDPRPGGRGPRRPRCWSCTTAQWCSTASPGPPSRPTSC